MSEFIGARISLVSRSDIRYVGTLHEINAETSTVALENVTSFGTEGRKNNQDEEIPASDSVYEYIVFRGSDVKDLRIEEAPAAKESKPPQVPNDPAILGSGSRPVPQSQGSQRQTPQGPPQVPPQASQASQQQQGPQAPPQGGPPFGQHPQYPPFYPPPGNWGRGGPGPGGFPGMPYGAPPPGWYPPPGQGFPGPHGPFPPYGYPPGPPGQFQQGPPNSNQAPKPAPIGPGAKQSSPPASQQAERQTEPKSLAQPAAEMAAAAVQKAPTPPVEPKPSTETDTISPQPSASQSAASAATKAAIPAPKNNRIQPAIPLQSPAAPKTPLQAQSNAGPSASLRDATQAATAAVAAAMAKLPPAGQTNGNAVDNLARKVNEMRTSDPVRAPRQPQTSGGFNQSRGGRGGRPTSRNATGNSTQKVDVPTEDFDFESSNAKFNKQDLVKEAIAGSPLGEAPPELSPEPEAPVSGYNKSASFFDNISSESKDRMESSTAGTRPGGREWRGEEQKKNVETFGQGSVDNGYRGGFRGRGRGRGYRGRGFSGNGQPGRGRGGYRGRGDAQTTVQ